MSNMSRTWPQPYSLYYKLDNSHDDDEFLLSDLRYTLFEVREEVANNFAREEVINKSSKVVFVGKVISSTYLIL